MSIWGSWWKISKLLQVKYVEDFSLKSSLFNFTTTWEAFFCEKYQLSRTNQLDIKSLQCPNGVQRRFTQRGALCCTDGWEGWDGISKVSFTFFLTLWTYRKFIYVLIYILENCDHSYWFQNFMSSWGSCQTFQNYRR